MTANLYFISIRDLNASHLIAAEDDFVFFEEL